MKNFFSMMVLHLLFGCCLEMFGQNKFNIQPFSDEEIEKLRTADGCGCYFSDANHCNGMYYLFGDGDLSNDGGYSIPNIYLKINGKITKFSYESRQYSLRFTGDPEPVFDLFFDNFPNEQDKKNAISEYVKEYLARDNVNYVMRDKDERNIWKVNVGKDSFFLNQDPIDEYYLFISENYVLRLYEYKHGSGIESHYTKGEVFIYKKEGNRLKQSLFFNLICGC